MNNQATEAILLLAHGSPLESANQEICSLCAKLQARLPDLKVEFSFLSSADPSLDRAIDDLIAKGLHRVLILPYFLVSGKHTSVDIPAMVEKKTAQYPTSEIKLLPVFGLDDRLIDVIVWQLK